METGRGKKGKKAGWHLTLRLKDTIFAGIGVVGLMMMSFALGALAGRGDIYRAAYSWGLLSPDTPQVAQWLPPPTAPAVAPAAAPGTAGAPTSAPLTVAAGTPAPGVAPAAVPPAPGTPVTVAAKPAPAPPVTGSIVPLAPPVPAATASHKKDKGKTGTSHRDHKSREEEMRKVRQEMVQKLKFQNSFDTGPKPKVPKAKDRDKAKAQPKHVQVAQYRTSKEAQAKVAELQKKGVKATVKTTKDAKGACYTVYKSAPAPQPGTEKVAQKPDKSGGATHKPKTD
ncbi:MAG: hypothetical protein M0P73_16965 [Syntrophobacterales bacterium]|nr:hypothetical protein [Syntrophobacterales bacterium]